MSLQFDNFKDDASFEKQTHEDCAVAIFRLGKNHYGQYVISFQTEDFQLSKERLEMLAQQNNADAQFLLGMLYKASKGVHDKAAIHWFFQAEQNGVKVATYEPNQPHFLLEMLHKALEERHEKEAIHWFFQAEQNGVKVATYEPSQPHFLLEMLHKAPKGEHEKEAIHWFLQAEQNGMKVATYEPNQLLHSTKEKNEEDGYAKPLFQLVKYHEFEKFYKDVSKLLKKVTGQKRIPPKNKKETREEDFPNLRNYPCAWMRGDKKHINLLERLANEGNVRAYFYLGELYYEQEMQREAVYWLKKRAQSVNDNALSYLEKLFYPPEEYPYQQKNWEAKLLWFGNLAEKGDDYAYSYLKDCYNQQKKWEFAAHWLEKNGKTEDSDALYFLGKQAYELRNWEIVLYCFGKLAEIDGDRIIDMQGLCSWKTFDFVIDEEIFKWEEKVAKRSHIRAIDIVEEMHHFSIESGLYGTDIMFEWEEKLAELGYEEAQYRLGMYCDSEQDYDNAIKWFEKAAQQGYGNSQYRAGMSLYRQGKDHNKAIYWLNQAKLQVVNNYHLNYLPLDASPKHFKNLTQESWQIVICWYETFAEKGHYLAQLYLGICYNEGLGVQKNVNTALFWLEKSIQLQYIETFRYLEETELLKIDNPYYEQIRKVEKAQPLKREFIEDWLFVNQERFEVLNNSGFEKRFEDHIEKEGYDSIASYHQYHHVCYIFLKFYKYFQKVSKYPPDELYRDLFSEYSLLVEGQDTKWVYNEYYRENRPIVKNPEEVFEWLIKNKQYRRYVGLCYQDCTDEDEYQLVFDYLPDFDDIFLTYFRTEEFKKYAGKDANHLIFDYPSDI